MTPMIEKFNRMCNREWLNGREAKTTAPIPNDYYKDGLPEIPAGTPLVCDFAGEFGMYALADIGGVLHKVKIPLEHLHEIQISED